MTLLIFKVNQLGDNVVFLPVVQALARACPGWRLVVYTSPAAARLYEVACPEVQIIPHATAAFNTAWRKPWQLAPLAAQARALRPQACLVANDQGNVAHLLAALSGATKRTGPEVKGRWLGGLLSHRVPLLPEDAPALQNWKIASALAADLDLPSLPARPPAPDLSAFGSDAHGGIVIHPGASRVYQRWPLERYIQLANLLAREHPVTWVLQQDAAEQALAPGVARFESTTLDALIRRLAGARLFVGNNSGPMHIASALGVPGVIPCGPSTLGWDPFWHRDRFDLVREPLLSCQPCDQPGRPVNVCQNQATPHACLERWSVEQMHDRVLAWLKP